MIEPGIAEPCLEPPCHAAWRVTGLDCPDCARTVSASVKHIPGVLSANLNFASATLLVQYDPAFEPLADVERVVQRTGHGLTRLDEEGRTPTLRSRPWIQEHLAEVATVGNGAFSLLGGMLGWIGAAEWSAVSAFAVAIVFGGLLVWRRAFVSLKARILDMNVLMSVAVFGAMALGEWGEGAAVFFLYALGGLLESRTLDRTRRSIRDLMDLAPQTARVLRDSAFLELPVADVLIGETLVVRPGERVAFDGVVTRGVSAVDESAITGESVPADKSSGDGVFAGTLNTSGLLEVEVTTKASGSMLARIVYLVEEAQASRAPAQRFVDRFSAIYTPSVIVLAVAIAVVIPAVSVLLGTDWGPASEWFRRSLVVLVVSCPCALVISTPVSIVSGITRASHDGILVKGGAFLESVAKVRAVAFDKTGTLTLGRPVVRSVLGFAGHSSEAVLDIAAVLEAHSNHPIARAIVAAAGERVDGSTVADFAETPGRGVSGTLGGVRWELCSPDRAHEVAALTDEIIEAIDALEASGATVLVLVSAAEVAGVIGVADEVRPEAARALAALKRVGIEHLIMLTGDNVRVAEAVAAEVGVTSVMARLLPAAKTDAVRVLQERYGVVAMVGDGVNDAPALALSDIGIAMGAGGTDTALDTADVVLMRDDLMVLAGFVSLGRRTMQVIVQNVAVSIGIKVLFLGLALAGKATLWMAVFADTGVALLVILNGMRLLRQPKRDGG